MPMSSSRSGPIVPLYHPTSILLVDDNTDFLRSLQLVLKSQFECFAFASADEAIKFIRSEPSGLTGFTASLGPEPLSAMEHIRDPAERLLHLKVSQLPRLFADTSRFARSSVLVADNAMPGMSGLEMLESLRDVPMRKLLLSGTADEGMVRQALGSGLIDAFYPKHHPALHDGLMCQLRALQLEFFAGVTEPFQPALATGDTRFLQDETIREVFAKFVVERGIVEHCVLMQPPGILGLDDHGNAAILLIVDDDYRQASFEIAQAEGAPPALLRQLIGLQSLAVFPTLSGFYAREVEDNWGQFIWPSVALADDRWQVATIDEPDVVRKVCGRIACHADYTKRRLN